MTSFKARNPDIIFISAYEEAAALAINHAFDVCYRGKFLYTSDWGVKAEKIVGLDGLEGSMVQALLHTYYSKYPDQEKREYATAFIKKYLETYKEDFAQPGLTVYDPVWMFARATEIGNSFTDANAIRAAYPEALQEGKLSIIFPNNDVLKNGLLVGAPELPLEIKGFSTGS